MNGACSADDRWIDLTTAGELAGLSPRVILLAVVSDEIERVDTGAARPNQWRLWREEFISWLERAQRPDPEPALALAG